MLSDTRGFGSYWSETIFWSHFFSFLSVTTTLMSTKLGLQDPYITLNNNLCVFIDMQCSSVSNNVCASHFCVDPVQKLCKNMSAVHGLLWCFVWIWCGSYERTWLLYMTCYGVLCGSGVEVVRERLLYMTCYVVLWGSGVEVVREHVCCTWLVTVAMLLI
jgi:hypothetical protein